MFVGRYRWLVASLATSVLPVLNYFAGRLGLTPNFPGSEMFTAPVVVDDLFSGGSLGDWSLPEAPYYVPDWPIWAGIRLLGSGPYESVWLFFLIQLALLVAAWWLVAPWFGGTVDWHRRAFGGSALLAIFVTVRLPAFEFALVSYWRFGTVVLVVAGLGLTLRWLNCERLRDRRAALGLLGVLVFLGHLSDEMILVWFTVPAAAALVFVVWSELRPMNSLAAWLAVVGAGHVFGALLEGQLAQSVPYEASFSMSGASTRVGALYAMFRLVLYQRPFMSAFLIAALCALVAVLFGRSRNRLRRGGWAEQQPEFSGRRFLAVHIIVAIVVSAAAQVLLDGPPLGLRYSTVFFVLAALYAGSMLVDLVSMVMHNAVSRSTRHALGFASTGFVVILTLSLVTASDAGGYDLRRTFPDVDCVTASLGETDSERGVSHWTTHNMLMFYGSFEQLIVPYRIRDDALDPAPWPRNVTHDRETYDFAVAGTLNFQPILTAADIVDVGGEPLSEEVCGEFTVLYYGPDGLDLSSIQE